MFNSYRKDYTDKGHNRPPLYTLKEFSMLVEVPYATLLGRMKRSKEKPEFKLKVKMNMYYELSDLKAWHGRYVNNICSNQDALYR